MLYGFDKFLLQIKYLYKSSEERLFFNLVGLFGGLQPNSLHIVELMIPQISFQSNNWLKHCQVRICTDAHNLSFSSPILQVMSGIEPPLASKYFWKKHIGNSKIRKQAILQGFFLLRSLFVKEVENLVSFQYFKFLPLERGVQMRGEMNEPKQLVIICVRISLLQWKEV